MQRFPDSHRPLADAARIARYLIDERFTAELGHMSQARVLYVISEREVIYDGWPAHAYICRAKVQGRLSMLLEDLLAAFAGFDGYDPDFVVRFDRARWDELEHTDPAAAWWAARDYSVPAEMDWSIGRELLVFHELKHTYHASNKDGDLKYGKDGRPVLALRPHDTESFDDEYRYYGTELCLAGHTAAAIADGARADQATRKRA